MALTMARSRPPWIAEIRPSGSTSKHGVRDLGGELAPSALGSTSDLVFEDGAFNHSAQFSCGVITGHGLDDVVYRAFARTESGRVSGAGAVGRVYHLVAPRGLFRVYGGTERISSARVFVAPWSRKRRRSAPAQDDGGWMEVRTTTARRFSAHSFARELRFGLFLVLGMVACVVVLRAAGEGDAPSRIEIEFEPHGDLRWDRGRQPVLQVMPRRG